MGQQISEDHSDGRRPSVGKRGLIRGGGLVTRISDDKEPQVDDYGKYCERPVRKEDSVTLGSYGTLWSHNTESDDSEDEEMLPMGEFWPIPEEDWTVVERSHGKPRCTNSSDWVHAHNTGRTLDNSGLCCDELDDIIDTKALVNVRMEATRIADSLPKIETEVETVIVTVKPIVWKRPDGIEAVSIDTTDGREICQLNVVALHEEGSIKLTASGHRPECCSLRDLMLFRTRWPRWPLREIGQIYVI